MNMTNSHAYLQSDMSVEDIQGIMSGVNTSGKSLYITQEVVYGAGQPVTPNQYTSIGQVQEYISLKSFTIMVMLDTTTTQIPLGYCSPTGPHRFYPAVEPSES